MCVFNIFAIYSVPLCLDFACDGVSSSQREEQGLGNGTTLLLSRYFFFYLAARRQQSIKAFGVKMLPSVS